MMNLIILTLLLNQIIILKLINHINYLQFIFLIIKLYTNQILQILLLYDEYQYKNVWIPINF